MKIPTSKQYTLLSAAFPRKPSKRRLFRDY